MTRPNPDIALIYHYDLARALAGEIVDWQIIPVNVAAGREGGDLCRAAADFAKRRDLFAMPAPTTNDYKPELYKSEFVIDEIADPHPSAGAQQAAEPDPPTAPGSATTIDRAELIDRIRELLRWHPEAETLLRRDWPDGVPTLKHDGHSETELAMILRAVRRVEAEVGAEWVPGDVTSRSGAINRARKAWKDSGRSADDMWFAAVNIATFKQCQNPDTSIDVFLAQFTIEQANRLHDAAAIT